MSTTSIASSFTEFNWQAETVKMSAFIVSEEGDGDDKDGQRNLSSFEGIAARSFLPFPTSRRVSWQSSFEAGVDSIAFSVFVVILVYFYKF